MKWKILQPLWLTTLILMLGLLVLAGCGRTGGKIDVTDTVAASTLVTPSPQPTETPVVPTVTVPDQGYPAPNTAATIAPPQDTAPYPAPTIVTRVVQSPTPTLTLQSGENDAGNPYPLIDTPVVQQAGSSSASPYPPPAGEAESVPTVSTLPGTQPVETVPVATPQAAIIKTRLEATDPATVSLEAGRPQLVMFFADWCTLCKSVAPVVLSLDSQYNNRMNFIYLDVEDPDTKTLSSELGYRVIAKPRIYLLDPQGIVLRDWIGYVSLEELQEAINSISPTTP